MCSIINPYIALLLSLLLCLIRFCYVALDIINVIIDQLLLGMAPQAVKFLSIAAPVGMAWLLLVMDWVPQKWRVPSDWRDFIYIFPIFVILLLACYSLASLGLGVARFNDCSQAAESLREEIVEAKADLRRRGFKI